MKAKVCGAEIAVIQKCLHAIQRAVASLTRNTAVQDGKNSQPRSMILKKSLTAARRKLTAARELSISVPR